MSAPRSMDSAASPRPIAGETARPSAGETARPDTRETARPDTGETDNSWRRDLRWRWAAFASSEFGDALGFSALPIVAVLLLDASDLQVSMLTVLSGIVSAIVALPLGPWIEYRPKRPVMIGMDLLRFFTVGSIPLAAYLGVLTYGQLCVVAVVRMAATLAFNSAGVADLRNLVPSAHRGRANSRFETTLWAANAVGPPAGGLLISAVGASTSLIADAVSFLGSALAIRRLRTPEPVPPKRATAPHWGADIVAGWTYILRRRDLAALFLNSLVFNGCIMASAPLLTVFMLRDLGFCPWQYGLAFGLSAVAGIAGSLVVEPVVKRVGRHRTLLGAGVGRNLWLGLIPFASADTAGLVLITVSQLFLLLFVGVFNPTFATYRMDATDDRHMSRVVMAWSITGKTAQPIAIGAAGLLAAATSARIALSVLAVVLLTATALLPWRGPEARPEARPVPEARPGCRPDTDLSGTR